MKMEKMMMMLLLYVTLIMAVQPLFCEGVDLSPKAVEKWFKELSHSHAKEKLTKLHFYFHDVPSGDNPTAVRVAEANMTSKSPSSFGAVVVMDEPLTVGPEPTSELVGRAQGVYAVASQQEFDLLMTFNLVFAAGSKYSGSTVTVLGYNPVPHEYREMPILGGTGVFRLATGIATAKTYAFNATTGAAVVEYNVILLHH